MLTIVTINIFIILFFSEVCLICSGCRVLLIIISSFVWLKLALLYLQNQFYHLLSPDLTQNVNLLL